MLIKETETLYSDWDDSKYVEHELNVAQRGVQFSGVQHPDNPNCGVFGVKVYYGVLFNEESVFLFSGEKQYQIESKYISLRCLAFLTEVFINEVNEHFNYLKKRSKVRYKFKKRSVDDLFDDLCEALKLLRSPGGIKH